MAFNLGAAVLTFRADGVAELQKQMQGFRSEFKGLSEDGKRAADTVGTGMAAASAAIMVGVGAAVAKNMEFNAAISETQAVTQASEKDAAKLRDTILDLGAASVFTAREAAQGASELGKAGVQTADIMGGGLKGALDLAAAGNMNVADAAEIAATRAFKLRFLIQSDSNKVVLILNEYLNV